MINDYTIKMQVTLDKSDTTQLKDDISKAVGNGLKDGVKTAWTSVTNQLQTLTTNFVNDTIDTMKSFFSDAIDEMKNMLEYSQLSSSRTRELAFGYGLSSSEAYGWDTAMKMLGFSSEEDLFYANAQELSQFRKAFEKYSSYYTELYNSGFFETMQQYQFEMQDFKLQMQQDLIRFFVDNKDSITSAMKGILTITEWVVKGFSWFMGDSSSKVASTADVVSQYITTNQASSNANLNVTNNFNNVDSSTAGTISSEVNNEYRQIIMRLGGRV